MKTNSFIISWCLKQRSHNIKIIKYPRIYSVFINRRIFAATGCFGSKWFKWDSCTLYALKKSRVCIALKIQRNLSKKNLRNTHSKVKVVFDLIQHCQIFSIRKKSLFAQWHHTLQSVHPMEFFVEKQFCHIMCLKN